MKIKILDWSYQNIRGVNNLDISVEKCLNIPYRVSLIMMPNGYGKTTTQTLFRAVFDGSAVEWDYDTVLGFKPAQTSEQLGKFKVTLLINDSIYIVILKLNYHSGKASYSTSNTGELGGMENGHNLPSVLKSAFTQEFVKRFVFDGELAKEIIGRESQEAERTIRYLYQLNRISEMKNRIDDIVKEHQKSAEKVTRTSTRQGITKLKTEQNLIVYSLRKLKETKSDLEIELKNKKDRLSSIDKEITDYIKSDMTLRKQAEDLENERIEVEKKISEKTVLVLNELRNPFLISKSIAQKLVSLASKMQILRLPRTMSRQFFEELAETDKCICGRSLGAVEKNYILEKAENYLAEDQIGVINSIKSSIRGREFSLDLQNDINSLNQLVLEKNRIKSDWDRLQVQRVESGDDKLEKLEKEKEELDKDLQVITSDLRRLVTKDRHEKENMHYQENIPKCEEELEKYETKINKALGILSYIENAKKLKTYLNEIEHMTLLKLKERIKTETNEKLASIIKSESIRVEDIEGYLKLEGKAGASEGQSLAIAYSFLGSMFETSTYELPFIVDSPAGSLDLSVRREVSRIIPHLFNQLIVFITSGEKKGFTEYFSTYGHNNVQFLTIFKNEERTECVEGLEMFDSFQDEDERVVIERGG